MIWCVERFAYELRGQRSGIVLGYCTLIENIETGTRQRHQLANFLVAKLRTEVLNIPVAKVT